MRVLRRDEGLGAGRAVASKPRISNGQGEHPCDKERHVGCSPTMAEIATDNCAILNQGQTASGHALDRSGGRWVGEDKARRLTALSSRETHLNPALFFGVASIVLGLAAAVYGLSLARWSAIVDRVGRGSLPVLHLGEGGRMRQRWRSGNRHQKRPLRGCEKTGKCENTARRYRKKIA